MEKATETNWSSLPSDIVSLIKSLLLGKDSVILNCVCKAWKSAPTTALVSMHLIDPSSTLTNIIQFPLLMFIGRDNSICNFYHPINKTTYTLDIPEIADAKVQCSKDRYTLNIPAGIGSNATIRCSKDGWLLMSVPHGQVFFFNPITKERIDLPRLEEYFYCYATITFSSMPTSPDCVVLGIHDASTLSLSYIRHGEDCWTRILPDELTRTQADFIPAYCNPVFHNGIFYCLGMEGNLGIFDPKKEGKDAWSVLRRPKKPCTSIRRSYLIKWEGELMSVFEGRAGEFIKIFKFDELSMSWKTVTSLGNNTLFLSLTSSFSATFKETQALGVRNTIFLPRFRDKQHSVFYSQVTSRFHCLTLDYISSKDFYGTTEKLNCCWIQPNFERHSDEELQWHSG